MGSIGRYIFRTTFGAFLLVLVSLTGAIWITQALRDIDLMTSQGQTILVFLGVTSLVIPPLIEMIAPVALVVALAHVLYKLNSDSEIIVMNSAGMRPWRLFQPFLAVTIVVSLMLAALTAYVAPQCLRLLHRWLTEIRTDLVSNIVQPGRFIPIEQGLAFNIRERRANGLLVGIMLDDRRDPKERVTILAERGEILKNDRGSFLILDNGSIQRHDLKQRDPNIVMFDRYAFDLSQFDSGPRVITYSIRERYLWQLLWPDPNDKLVKAQPGQVRAVLSNRLSAPIYPFVFLVLAYTFLGAPRTTRQSPSWPISALVVSVSVIRLVGFVCTVLTLKYAAALTAQYVAMAAVLAGGLYAVSRGMIIEPPESVSKAVNAGSEWFMRRMGASMGPIP